MKKRNNIVYNLVNIVFLLLSILLVNYAGIFEMKFSIFELLLLIALFLILHFFKFIRTYFVLLEEKIPLKRIIKIYLKTTFVSIVLPYKLGEIFKMYSYGHEINNSVKGIIAVIIEKFFDAIILCAVLIPYGIKSNGSLSALSIIMLVFILVFIAVFISFESTYYYLNKFFIAKSQSKKTLYVLRILENVKKVYDKAKELIRGRGILLTFLTIVIWTIETGSVFLMSTFMGTDINFMLVVNYLSDAFFGISNVLFNNYIYICTAMFLVVIVLIYLIKIIKKGSLIWRKNQ